MLPDFNNVYGSLFTRRSKGWVASRFAKAGWSVRTCSWTDHELTLDGVELTLEGDKGGILLSGAVDDFETRIASVVAVLEENGVVYSFEHYDEAGGLLRTLEGGQEAGGGKLSR